MAPRRTMPKFLTLELKHQLLTFPKRTRTHADLGKVSAGHPRCKVSTLDPTVHFPIN